MALFDTLLTPTDENASATLYALLKALRVNVTRATVREFVEQHPDFPSLLCLSDVLTDWQVENTGLQLNTVEQLRELPFPFVAHLRKNRGWYVLVTALQDDTITYTDNEQGRRTEPLTDFEKSWTGVVLLAEFNPAEANQQAGEANYATKRTHELLEHLRGPFVLASLLLIAVFVLLSVRQHLTPPDWILLLTKSIGLTLSSLLVAKQLGTKNALTDRLCRISSKTNCDDVLNSPAAKLWGWLSWADVGLLYFAGGLLALLISPLTPEGGVFIPTIRPLLNTLALLALPYTLFSVYYQARVLRQWCSLCLGVQVILLSEGIMAISERSALPAVVAPYLLLMTAFLLPTVAWVLVKPVLITAQKSRREHDELMRFKRNPELFRAILMQQPQMPPIPSDLHPILLGNPKAEHTITVVTNPYCGPCAKTHKELEQLLSRNANVKANLIFASSGEKGTRVAIHAIALAEQGSLKAALADWYNQRVKDADAWAERYPVVMNEPDLMAVAERHGQWCRRAGITATPTVYVDGYQLPGNYRLKGLRWLINELEAVGTKTALSL